MSKTRCCGINFKEEQCGRNSFDICEDCGKPVCFFHGGRDKHKCDDSVKGCHSIWKGDTIHAVGDGGSK